ncbi:Dipeptide transport system permease protein DppB [compost metagenome]
MPLLVTRHMLRNAILPVLTILGPLTASVLTGAFVVENIFNIPGMGKYFVSSVQTNDYPMIAGTTLFLGAFLIGANLLVDLSYTLVDPNIKLYKAKV